MTNYRLLRHPLVRRDIFEIGTHIETVSGDPKAAERRMMEIDAAYQNILDRPGSGTRLDGFLEGYCVRHVGRDNMLSVIFQHDAEAQTIFIVHIAFGGRNWLGIAESRV